jgi:hypothetical protein
MVVKMRVRPIAKLIKTHAQTQAAHCFGIAGRDKGDFGSLGPECLPSAHPARANNRPYEPIVTVERNAGSSPLMVRVSPVTVNVAVERMSMELLPALNSTGPGSMTNSPEIPI